MSKNLTKAMGYLAKAQEELSQRVDRHEKILTSQGQQIASLEKQVMDYRNNAIRAEVEAGAPKKDVADRYGLTPGRITQLTKH